MKNVFRSKLRLFKAVATPVSLAAFAFFTATGQTAVGGVAFVLFWLTLAWSARGYEATRPFCYPLVVLACVTSSMFFPFLYREWFGQPTTTWVVPVLQLIMFGMGTQLTLRDFRQVIVQPWGVIIGVAAQFIIMPTVGFAVASVFPFPKEVAAGIILIGCVPSGIASNVMNYLAKANVALSVTLTACATLLGPILTPLWMKALIGTSLPIDYAEMTRTIISLVVLPIAVGFLFRTVLPRTTKFLERYLSLLSMIGLLLTIVFINAAGRDELMKVGVLLILACLIHNTLGYIFGYGLAKLCRFDEESCRTISLEVGMQNGGLAAGLATKLGLAATMGLAPAVCSPLMNITGASLAIWWRGRKKTESEETAKTIKASKAEDAKTVKGESFSPGESVENSPLFNEKKSDNSISDEVKNVG